MNLAQFQAWLNAHGADLTVDGKAGPATRKAVIDTFRNTATAALPAHTTGMTKVWGHGLLATVDTAVRGIRFKLAGAAFLVGRFFR